MNRTDIEYLDFTWSPLAMLCDPISVGCQNCWHRRRAKMLANNPTIPRKHQKAYAGKISPLLIESRLEQPLKRKKPSIIGVQFMGDLFHKRVALCDIDEVFEVIAQSVHTFLILTKRVNTMAHYCNTYTQREIHLPDNLWVGASVENPDNLWRIDELLKIPAAVRFISVEPMLAPIEFDQFWSALGVGIDWVVIGCESGPRRRSIPIKHIEALVVQCNDAGVPVFVKQAEIDGKLVKMPKILGRTWAQFPEVKK